MTPRFPVQPVKIGCLHYCSLLREATLPVLVCCGCLLHACAFAVDSGVLALPPRLAYSHSGWGGGSEACGNRAFTAVEGLRLRGGGAKRSSKGRFFRNQPGRRGGGNDAHLKSIKPEDFKEDVGAGRKLSRDRKRDAALQEWMRDDPYDRPNEGQHC